MSEQTPKKRKMRWLLFVVMGIGAILLLCILIGVLSGPSDKETAKAEPTPERTEEVARSSGVPATAAAEPTAEPTKTPKPSDTPRPTRTPVPTRTPQPSPTPTTPPTPQATVAPIALQGLGQTATDQVELPSGIYVAHFTHGGRRNFVVNVYQGDAKDLLINHIGGYDGVRPLTGGKPLAFDIMADGPWTISIQQIDFQDGSAFTGQGDDVSGLFAPPSAGPWEIKHTGQRNFIVYARCAGGSSLVQNEIGAVDGSRMVTFRKGPCFWEVMADGKWSLEPR